MPFEFDIAKSISNKQKHGIDFNEAQALWEDADRLEIPARMEDEPRYMVIGKIAGRHWTAVVTYRGRNIRIISVRMSHRSEVKLYESKEL